MRYALRALRVIRISLRHLLTLALDRILKRPGLSGPIHLRVALEEMSGSFLKFGQILSLQVDMLPRVYCDALLDLLDRVPPFSAEQVKKVFMEEFDRPAEDLYQEFDYKPIASASIGQVHRGILHDGTQVAVKVQRPGIEEVFMRDATLLKVFVKLVFFFRIRTLYFMRDPVREFNEWIHDELDYRREATYAEMLRRNAEQTPSEKVPRVYWRLTTSHVFTMDYLKGYSVLECLRLRESGDLERWEELKKIGFDPSVFVSNVVTNFVSDALRFGVFHADLHPANLLILENNSVGYVDFGIVGTLTTEARRKIIQLTLAYVSGKTEDIYSSFLDISTLSEGADLTGFRRDLERKCLTWYQEPAIAGMTRFRKTLNLAMIDLLTLCRSYGLLPNREMIKYIRSVVLADGLVSRLAPGLDYAPQLARLCEDYLRREAQNRVISPKAALTVLADLASWMQAGPGPLLRAMETMERRQTRMRIRLLDGGDGDDALRVRAILATVVWIVIVGWIGISWPQISRRVFSLPGYLLMSFSIFWTLWLIVLLRRLGQKS